MRPARGGLPRGQDAFRRDDRPAPRLGDGVDVGVGPVIIRGVTIGDACRIGAGAVVVTDVAAGVTVAGNPARPLAAARSM